MLSSTRSGPLERNPGIPRAIAAVDMRIAWPERSGQRRAGLEAGTGTGKTFAISSRSALAARSSFDGTKTLQDQPTIATFDGARGSHVP